MKSAPLLNIASDAPKDFEYWWQREGDWVEPPNHRRQGISGVKRINEPGTGVVFVKTQVNHLHRSLRHPFGRPTAFREAEAIHACQALGIKVPEILYCGKVKSEEGWKTVLVTHDLSGFTSLDQWLESSRNQAGSEGIRAKIIEELAWTLSLFHHFKWQHGCLYPKHIFVRVEQSTAEPAVEIALIDLEKCRRRLTSKQAAEHDLSQLKRHLNAFTETDWQALNAHYQHFLESTGK